MPTDPHQDLLQKKGGNAFPYIVFMDDAGSVLVEHEAELTAEAFARTGRRVRDFLDLKAKAEKGDPGVQADYALAQLEFGRIPVAEARGKLEGRTLSKEQQAKLDGLVSTSEVREVMKTVTQEDATQTAAARKFHERMKAKKAPPSDERLVQPYFILVMNWAEEEKDAALFEECLKALRERFGGKPEAQEFFKAKDQILKKLLEENKK